MAKPIYSLETVRQAITMRRQGQSCREIGRALGINFRTVANWFTKLRSTSSRASVDNGQVRNVVVVRSQDDLLDEYFATKDPATLHQAISAPLSRRAAETGDDDK